MSKGSYFFATKTDLLAITERVESKFPVKYVRCGHVTKLPPETFQGASQIPNLGIASNRAAIGCDKFLVAFPQLEIKPRPLKKITIDRYAIDQLYNPETITLTVGGLWEGEILLSGDVAFAHDTEASEKLIKLFRAAIKSNFTRVRAFWVGPQALEMLKAGKRLTPDVQSPPEYDLKLEA